VSAAPVDLSPVALLAAILGMFVGPTLLPLASAYAVISAGALIGALIGLYRRAPCTARASVMFVIIVWIATTFCTVPMAGWIANYFQQAVSWWFFPVSLAVASVGEDWLKLPLASIPERVRKLFGGSSS
jgi:hypothetical protein